MNDLTNQFKITSGSYQYTYYFDSVHYYREWKRGSDKGIESYPLNKLTNKYSEYQGRPDAFKDKATNVVLFLFSSIIIYFSDYNESIPLLAPTLLIIGAIRMYFLKELIFPKKWSVIRYTNGEEASFILHDTKHNEDRIKFEKALSDAIDNSN